MAARDAQRPPTHLPNYAESRINKALVRIIQSGAGDVSDRTAEMVFYRLLVSSTRTERLSEPVIAIGKLSAVMPILHLASDRTMFPRVALWRPAQGSYRQQQRWSSVPRPAPGQDRHQR